MNLARLTLPLAALLLLTPAPTLFPVAAQEPASQPAPPQDGTQLQAPVVRNTPRPRPIVLPGAPSSNGAASGSTARQSGAPAATPPPAVQQQPAPVVRRTPHTVSSATPGTGTASTQTTATRPASSFASKIPTTPYKPSSTSPLIQLSPGPFNRQVVFLDPAHGGNDNGSRIEDSVLEKDVTLQLAFKLRSLLTARGFTVVLSRETDAAALPNTPDTPLTLDARAGIGNRARPVACLLLHATGSGRGVHLYSSELAPGQGELFAGPWLTAQAPWVTQSIKLEKAFGQAISRSDVPLVMGRASIRPVDSLTCPALVVELAPKSGSTSSLKDDSYQQQVASAIATALIFWQNTAQPPPRLTPAPSAAPAPSLPSTTMPGADRAPSLPAAPTGGQP